jgi:hypothetical protein
MFRSLFAGALFLSTIAACQSATPAGIPSPDSALSANPLLICFGQSPVTALLGDSVPPAGSLGLNGCTPVNHLSLEVNQAPVRQAAANSPDVPEAPSAFHPSSADEMPEVRETRFVSPTLSVEQNTRSSARTLDGEFTWLHTLSAMALVADLETTARGLEGQAKGSELDPVFGAHPTRARLYGIAVPLNVLSFYLSYHYKKIEPGRSIWKVAPGLSIAVHTGAAINNLIAAQR